MKMTKLTTLAAVTVSSLVLSACMSSPMHMDRAHDSSTNMAHSEQAMSMKNLVQVAQSNKDFSILVEAVAAAGLVDTLATTPNLTVFAPTNQAFVNLLNELGMTKSQLLANPALLKQVLTYHVVPATVYSSQVKAGMVKTVQGTSFSISNDGKISDAKGRVANLIKTDIKASNGVIHVIDKVLLP
ncbi:MULTISPECIES: fasciclin domain-containing protein [Psychrobacter]|jgi:uncharacterized surface protein with fasciclin (FAS1) repeats|uniref:Fasciclin domain-containing protein n=1 Tax=Psychrobacter sanguinis TaxID=861445 RepID=A0A844M0H6_9GAMM|nr:fasciclin domain-containing protein [Psychrobacter sanguinis]MUG32436.1 fasciclin domain-containing protein [Psychrobacter sanguinis]